MTTNQQHPEGGAGYPAGEPVTGATATGPTATGAAATGPTATGPAATAATATGRTAAGTAATGTAGTAGSHPSDGRSLGDIVGDIANDLTTLVKQEIELAKTEAKTEATKAGKGVGLLGGAGVAGHLLLLFLSLALMFLLDNWMHTGWAALIVAAVWGIAAAVMAMRGRKELKAMNPKLETTQRTLKEDVAWAKQQKNG